MTFYTVEWLVEAEDELADIYLRATDKAAVTRAQAAIDNQLRLDPVTKGSVVADKLWKMAVSSLLVYYSIDAPRKFVEVSAVRLIP